EPGNFSGFAVVDEPDTFGWADLWTPDALGAQTFYRALLGWESESLSLPLQASEYILVRPEGTGRERALGGVLGVAAALLEATEGAARWQASFVVVDCDVGVDLVEEGGGQVHSGPEDVPMGARVAICSDPLGAGFVLLENA